MNLLDASKEVRAILGRLHEARVTVFGDFCVDAYWDLWEGESEDSIETGLPVRRVQRQRYTLGGAGSVVANLRAMGVGCVRVVGVEGEDIFGEKLRYQLRMCGADLAGLLTEPAWETMVYAKPYLGLREHSRIDFGSFNQMSAELLDRLLCRLEDAVAGSDVVIVNQQMAAGVSSGDAVEHINGLIAKHSAKVFLVDARHGAERYKGAVVKLNMSEAARFLQEAPAGGDEERARDFALRIGRATGELVFVTRGEAGLVIAEDGVASILPGLQVQEPIDPVGAGDAVVAAVGAALAVGASAFHAGVLANVAAMITVKKLKTTGTASAEEILSAMDALHEADR